MKEANLLEQGSTLVGDVVQGLLFLHFRSLQAQSLKRLLAVYAVLPKLQPGEGGPHTCKHSLLQPRIGPIPPVNHTIVSSREPHNSILTKLPSFLTFCRGLGRGQQWPGVAP